MTTTCKHNDLGDIRGNSCDGVVQFLGLKYASLENRFASPSLVTHYSSGLTDATKYGYSMSATPLGSCLY
jgi:carboxylesterase type B